MKYTFRSKFDLFESIIGVKPHPTTARQILPDDYYIEADNEAEAYAIISEDLSAYIENYFFDPEKNDDEINEWISKFEHSLSIWAEDEAREPINKENGLEFYILDTHFCVEDILICRFYDFEFYPVDENTDEAFEEAFEDEGEEE